MTNKEKNERIKAVEEEMAKLQKELEDIRNEETSEWDFSEWDNAPLRKRYEFDVPANMSILPLFAEKLDMLLKLIKFKFCYDYSYIPNWSDAGEWKWYVYFNTKCRKYDTDSVATWDRPPMIYFSTQEIAQKCADWLNAGCQEE